MFLTAVGSLDLGAVAAGSQAVTIGASGDINLVAGVTLTAGSVSLTAGGAISGTATSLINTSTAGGNISLASASGVGGSGNPFLVLAGTGTVSASSTTGTVPAPGHIYLASTGALKLGTIATAGSTQTVDIRTSGGATNHINLAASSTTNDNWTLVSTGDISISGATTLTAAAAILTATGNIVGGTATIDINTSAADGDITLSGKALGDSANSLNLSADEGEIRLMATGTTAVSDGIFVNLAAGDLVTNNVTMLSAAAVGASVVLSTTDGEITINSVAGWSVADDKVTLKANGTDGVGLGHNITFSGATTLVAAEATLDAAGSIRSGGATQDIDTSVANGAISLTAGTAIGVNASNRFAIKAGTGDVTLVTGGDIFIASIGSLDLAAVSTGANAQTVNIQATSTAADNIRLLASSGVDTDNWTLVAGNNISLDAGVTLTTGSATLDAGGDISFVGNATLTAGSAALTADGAIVGTATSLIDTSGGAGGNIGLASGSGVGSAGTAFRVRAGSGVVSASSTLTGAGLGDIYLTSDGVLNLGAISTAASIQTVDVKTTGAGSHLNLKVDSPTNDDWTLNSASDIDFATGVTLTARSATLTAAGGIHGSGGGNTDIDTSAANGIISLTAVNGSIGDSASAPIIVTAFAGNVDLHTGVGGGSIYVSSAGVLDLAEVTTAAGTQTVDIRTTGANSTLHVVSPITTDDSWTLNSSADIQLLGTASIKAAEFTEIRAVEGIVGGNAAVDFDSSQSPSNLKIVAGSIGAAGNLLVVDTGFDMFLGAGLLDLTANTGDLHVAVARGNLTAARFAGPIIVNDTGVTIALGTLDGSIDLTTQIDVQDPDDVPFGPIVSLKSLRDNSLWLEAHGTPGDLAEGNINLGTTETLTFQSVTLLADGQIQGLYADGTTAIDTTSGPGGGGDVTLKSRGPIGSAAFPLVIEAGTGVVSVTTTGADADGDIYLGSSNTLNLGQINTDAGSTQIIRLVIPGDINISSEINANEDILQLISTSGDIVVTAAGSIQAQQVFLQASDGSISSSGDIEGDLVSLYALGALGTISLSGTGTIEGDTVELVASTAITSTASADPRVEIASTGTLFLRTSTVGQSGLPLTVKHNGGEIDLLTSGDVYLELRGDFATSQITGEVSGSHLLSLAVVGGSLNINEALVSGDDQVVLAATGNIVFSNNVTLAAQSANLSADGVIRSDSTGLDVLDIDALAGITLSADLGIGELGDPLAIRSNVASTVTLTTDSSAVGTGNIYVQSQGSFSLGVVTTATGKQTVAIDVVGAGYFFAIDADNTTDDAWLLTTEADFFYNDSYTIQAASFALVAGGGIFSGALLPTDIDIDTVTTGPAGGGNISLTGKFIGADSAPLALKPGTGNLSLVATGTATTDGIWVAIKGGGLYSDDITTLSAVAAGATISLEADGKIVLAGVTNAGSATGFLDNTTNDHFLLSATDDIEFSGLSTLTAASVALDTAGDIVSGTAASDIATSALGGPIYLQAGGAIGADGNPFAVSAGAGAVSATTFNPGGNIFLYSNGQLQIGSIFSTGDAKITATGAILPGGNAVDIETAANGTIDLAATALGTSTAPLVVRAGTGDVSLDTSSGADGTASIYLRSDGSLDLASVTTAAGTQTVDIRTVGADRQCPPAGDLCGCE